MKKVLAIIDVPNWAMHNRVLALQKHLSNDYIFDTKLFNQINNKDNLRGYDVVYVLNWVLHKKLSFCLDKPGSRDYKLVTTVCSHGGRNSPLELRDVFSYYDKISASSMFLYKELFPVFGKNILYTPFGVDSSIFKSEVNARLRRKTYGFVGKTNRDLKRYKNIQDAAKITKSVLRTVDHNSKLNRIQMNKFYNTVSAVICFSTTEGTPNPVLEGASCGRAVISTPVGNVPELFGKHYPIKPVESQSELVSAIKKLNSDPSLLVACSDYLEKRVKSEWDWKYKSKEFEGLFK